MGITGVCRRNWNGRACRGILSSVLNFEGRELMVVSSLFDGGGVFCCVASEIKDDGKL